MVRPASLFALIFRITLVFTALPAAAQQVGGEALDPEILSTPGAAELIRERAFARMQSFQAIRGIGSSGFGVAGGSPGAAANPNAANPALDRSAVNQQALARIPSRGDAGFLAGFSGGQALAPSRVRPPVGNVVAPTFIDESKTVVVNAFQSPVSIGNGNTVQQQVANSTAISVGGPASATAAADKAAGHGKPAGAGVMQSATGSATALGAPTGSAGGSGKVAGREAPR